MADDQSNGNGRVTMAVLSTKLDALTSLVRDYCERQQQDHDAIGVVRTDLAGKARG